MLNLFKKEFLGIIRRLHQATLYLNACFAIIPLI